MKFDRYKQIIENFFSLSILNGLNVLLPFVTLPYILRIIGTENYGAYSYIYAIAQYVIMFVFSRSSVGELRQGIREVKEMAILIKSTFYISEFLGRSLVRLWFILGL